MEILAYCCHPERCNLLLCPGSDCTLPLSHLVADARFGDLSSCCIGLGNRIQETISEDKRVVGSERLTWGCMLKKIKGDIELIGRHLEVLSTVAQHQPIGIIKLSEILNFPQHRIRYSLRVMEGLGYIRASPTGAVTTEKADELFSNLDADIGEIIALLKGMRSLTDEV